MGSSQVAIEKPKRPCTIGTGFAGRKHKAQKRNREAQQSTY